MTSAPTVVHIVKSAIFDIGLCSTQTTAAVFASLSLANSSAACVYGVFPLAAIAMTRSLLVSFLDLRSVAAFSGSSSLPSKDSAKALGPPAITACTHSFGVLNVGGHSA